MPADEGGTGRPMRLQCNVTGGKRAALSLVKEQLRAVREKRGGGTQKFSGKCRAQGGKMLEFKYPRKVGEKHLAGLGLWSDLDRSKKTSIRKEREYPLKGGPSVSSKTRLSPRKKKTATHSTKQM